MQMLRPLAVLLLCVLFFSGCASSNTWTYSDRDAKSMDADVDRV